MAVAGQVVIEMAANVARLTQDFDRARREVGASVGRIDNVVSGAMHGIQAIIAGTAVVGLAHLIEKALAVGDEIQKMSVRLGIGAESLQRIGHAARLAGIEASDFETGLRNLNRNLAEAAAGQQSAVRLFQDLGISVRDAGGAVRGIEDVLGDFAEKIKATADPAERTRLAMEAFGRSGTLLLPMLKDGRDGMEELGKEATRLGLVLSADLVAQAEKTKDTLETVAAVVKINLTRAILALAPTIDDLGRKLVENASTWRSWADSIQNALRRLRITETPGNLLMEESVGGLKKQLAEVEHAIELQAKQRRDPLEGLLGSQARSLANLRTRRAELSKEILGIEETLNRLARAQAPAISGPTVAAGPSAEQLAAIDKLRDKVLAAAVPDAVARSFVEFRKQVEELATTIPSRADEIRKLGKAFEDITIAAENAKRSVAGVDAATAAAGKLGLETSIFAGFKEIDEITKDADAFRLGIENLARAGVPVRDLFNQTREISDALSARIDALTQKYDAQPAVLERVRTALAGLRFGDFQRDLDAVVRSITSTQQGFAGLTITMTGELPAGLLAVQSPLQRVTSDVQALAVALFGAASNARVLTDELAEVGP